MPNNIAHHPLLARLIARGRANPRTAHLTGLAVKNRRELLRFTKFAIVGSIGAVVDFIVLNVMHLVVGLDLLPSNIISFTLAVLSNFTWNRLWTFPESQARPLGLQLLQFALVNVIGLAINTAVLLSLNHYVFRPLIGPFGYNIAKAFAILIVLFWNFTINRLWTYKGIR